MHFCNSCDNMYYIRVDSTDTNKLIYYCRNCGAEDDTIASSNISVSKIQLKKNEKNFANIVNKYTKLDPTLPRINHILCPNQDCVTNTKKKEREIKGKMG